MSGLVMWRSVAAPRSRELVFRRVAVSPRRTFVPTPILAQELVGPSTFRRFSSDVSDEARSDFSSHADLVGELGSRGTG